MVDDEVRGNGSGRRLLSDAVTFCEQHRFEAIQLWTFDGLHAARHLYEAYGFQLAEERLVEQCGSRLLEQRFAEDGERLTLVEFESEEALESWRNPSRCLLAK